MVNYLKQLLEQLNLSENESIIYLHLIEFGEKTIASLSKETKMNRSTVHFNANRLLENGFVSETKYGKRRKLVAEPAWVLENKLRSQLKKLNELNEALPSIIDELNELSGQFEGDKTSVRYYDSLDGVKQIYREALKSGVLRSYVNLNKVSNTFPDNKKMFEEALEKGTKIKEIVEPSEVAEALCADFSKSKNFKYKIAPIKLKLSHTDVLIFGDNKVGVINLDKNVSGIVMISREYHLLSKSLFDFNFDTIK